MSAERDITSAQVLALNRMLACSTTLRDHIGATDYATAKALIGTYEVFDTTDANNLGVVATPRPRAWISKAAWSIERQGEGLYVARGNLHINIELIPPGDVWPGLPGDHDIKAEHDWFDGEISKILADMIDTKNANDTGGDGLNIFPLSTMECLQYGPIDLREESQYFWCVTFNVPFGSKA